MHPLQCQVNSTAVEPAKPSKQQKQKNAKATAAVCKTKKRLTPLKLHPTESRSHQIIQPMLIRGQSTPQVAQEKHPIVLAPPAPPRPVPRAPCTEHARHKRHDKQQSSPPALPSSRPLTPKPTPPMIMLRLLPIETHSLKR